MKGGEGASSNGSLKDDD